MLKIIDQKIIHETLQSNKNTERERDKESTMVIEMENQEAENWLETELKFHNQTLDLFLTHFYFKFFD